MSDNFFLYEKSLGSVQFLLPEEIYLWILLLYFFFYRDLTSEIMILIGKSHPRVLWFFRHGTKSLPRCLWCFLPKKFNCCFLGFFSIPSLVSEKFFFVTNAPSLGSDIFLSEKMSSLDLWIFFLSDSGFQDYFERLWIFFCREIASLESVVSIYSVNLWNLWIFPIGFWILGFFRFFFWIFSGFFLSRKSHPCGL